MRLCIAIARGFFIFALLSFDWGCPKPPTPPPPQPRLDASPASACATVLDGGVPTPCKNLFHAGDLLPCADCSALGPQARSCVWQRAAIWCASPSCGGDPSCGAQLPDVPK